MSSTWLGAFSAGATRSIRPSRPTERLKTLKSLLSRAAAVLSLTFISLMAACQSSDGAGGGGGQGNDGAASQVATPQPPLGLEGAAAGVGVEAAAVSVITSDEPVAVASEETVSEELKPSPAPIDELTDPESYVPPVFTKPSAVRGIYVNAWGAGSKKRSTALLELAQRTEVNSLVIDIKDATGYLSHRSAVPLARDIGATGEIRIRDLPGLLRRVDAAGVYPIARIVVTKDPLLSAARPDWAVQDTVGGVWSDPKGVSWLNPFEKEVWDYHVAIAREVAQLGFPEIQWDYVRFPDAPPSYMGRAKFPGSEGRTRAQGIRAFLDYARSELADLDVEVTADVFGVTTTFNNDVGIGQHWESFIDVVDVALPMIYPSHYYGGSYGYKTPNAYPYEIVRAALADAVERSASVEGAGSVRPWLQDFTLGAPRYGVAEVRAQILATYDAGVEEWVLWNPGGRYTEEALEPSVGSSDYDPLIRLGGEFVLSSEREAFLADRSRVTTPPPADTSREEPLEADSVSVDVFPVADTSRVPVGDRR